MTEQGPQDIGTRLRVAREQSGVSLRQIADVTKLSVRALDALEHGRLAQLPGGIYRRSIVRAYAGEIGLDPEVTLRAFLDQHPDDLPAPPQTGVGASTNSSSAAQAAVVAHARPRPRVMQGLLSLFGALVPILAGVLYFSVRARGSDVPRPLADLTPPYAADVVPVGGLEDAPRSIGRAVPMMITVSSRCQLQVVADGREVVGRSLEAGELLQLDLGRDVVFVGDDAGAVHFSINGRAGRRLGEAGTPLNVRIGRDDYEGWLVSPN